MRRSMFSWRKQRQLQCCVHWIDLWISVSNLRRWNHSLEQSDVRKAESFGKFKSLLKHSKKAWHSWKAAFYLIAIITKKNNYSSWHWREVSVGNFSQLFSLQKMTIRFFPNQKPSSSLVKTETKETVDRLVFIPSLFISIYLLLFWICLDGHEFVSVYC